MSQLDDAVNEVWDMAFDASAGAEPLKARRVENMIKAAKAEIAADAEKLRGDMHHLISPIIGALRVSEHHKEPLTEEDLKHMITRLYVALSLMDEAVTGTVVPDEVRGQYGVGLNHYPSLIDPDASPCIGAPHWEKS